MCISTLRLIRPVDEAPVLEVIKEFFYLVGCLFFDKPVRSRKDAEAELGKDFGTDFNVVLNLNVFGWKNGWSEWDDVLRWDGPGRISERRADSFIGDSGFIARDDRRIFVMYQPPLFQDPAVWLSAKQPIPADDEHGRGAGVGPWAADDPGR